MMPFMIQQHVRNPAPSYRQSNEEVKPAILSQKQEAMLADPQSPVTVETITISPPTPWAYFWIIAVKSSGIKVSIIRLAIRPLRKKGILFLNRFVKSLPRDQSFFRRFGDKATTESKIEKTLYCTSYEKMGFLG
jgi:hypothetical protein